MLNHATGHSLLLVDEFGKGTEQFSGCALMAATITDLLNRGSDCPRAIFTTHFWELFSPGLLPLDHPALQLSHMSVHIDPADTAIQAAFLYTVQNGATSHQPFAHFVAKHAGLCDSVVIRALTVLDNLKNSEPIVEVVNPAAVGLEQRCDKLVEMLMRYDFEAEPDVMQLVTQLRVA